MRIRSAASAAILDGTRPPTDRSRDVERRPSDVLALTEISPGETVVDVWPGPGYWTRLFSSAVGPTGRIIAYVPRETVRFGYKPLDLAQSTAAEPGRSNVTVSDLPLAVPLLTGDADLVFTAQNYHDLQNIAGADMIAFNRKVFRALKPGGRYVIIDHIPPPGSGLRHTKDLHRIDPATVRSEVEAAGFVLESTSTVLRNPEDPRTANVFDPTIRGRTDQFAYKFRKPRR
jgi:predicted methyltransferase